LGGPLLGVYFSIDDWVLPDSPGRLPSYGATVQGKSRHLLWSNAESCSVTIPFLMHDNKLKK
jgi:hypothetical protein